MLDLRPVHPGDRPALHSVMSDPEVARWLRANLVAYTRADNAASRRVMDKLGLTYEREFEHAGYPHVLYRTIREHNPR
jgi:hypothetical protein